MASCDYVRIVYGFHLVKTFWMSLKDLQAVGPGPYELEWNHDTNVYHTSMHTSQESS